LNEFHGSYYLIEVVIIFAGKRKGICNLKYRELIFTDERDIIYQYNDKAPLSNF